MEKMNTEQLKKQLKSESGFLSWNELEKHFARGVIRVISDNSNLINVATDIAQNNSENITKALAEKTVYVPTDSQALQWQKLNSSFLCIVVAPFVLIQINDTDSKKT